MLNPLKIKIDFTHLTVHIISSNVYYYVYYSRGDFSFSFFGGRNKIENPYFYDINTSNALTELAAGGQFNSCYITD